MRFVLRKNFFRLIVIFFDGTIYVGKRNEIKQTSFIILQHENAEDTGTLKFEFKNLAYYVLLMHNLANFIQFSRSFLF